MNAPEAAAVDRPRAITRAGEVEGFRQGSVDVYLGIPYAAPPIGGNRWRPPQPVAPWSGVRPATSFGSSALQAVEPEGFGPWTHEFVVQGEVGEDCLYLNVWVQRGSLAGTRPVLVWIHGGAFAQGSGSVAIYDGQTLASRGLVVVTLNYRLGALGFLAHPDLVDDDTGCSGNFGLQDQLAALRWVQQNIAQFGGDPATVTIAGQSAGAVSVHLLVQSPAARGLFQRAIAQSGPPTLLSPNSREAAEADGLAWAAELGCHSIDALRALDARQLLVAPSATPRFRPSADGVLLPAQPPRPGSPVVNDVPMLVGQTRDENSGLDPMYSGADAAALSGLLLRCFGAHAADWQPFYPGTDPAAVARAYRRASLDRWLAALWHWADQRAGGARSPLYVYLFDHPAPGPNAARYGCFHTSEVPYVMGTLDAAPERGFTARDWQISATVSQYWINFICHGSPNGSADALWPILDTRAPMMMRLAETCEPQPMFAPALLSALRQHLARGGSMQPL
jgi:para-nitrobenzyl esterase